MATPPAKKPSVDPKTALITTGVGAALIALITFLPATKPVVISACTGLIEQNGGTVSLPVEVSPDTAE